MKTIVSLTVLFIIITNIRFSSTHQSQAYAFTQTPSIATAVDLTNKLENTPAFQHQYDVFHDQLGSDFDSAWQQSKEEATSQTEKITDFEKVSPENPLILSAKAVFEYQHNNRDSAKVLYGKAKSIDPLIKIPELEALILQ
ncbi:MAG: hypothetical protein ACMG6E_03215 [Candidatus Roizmanbacteria bacterium]